MRVSLLVDGDWRLVSTGLYTQIEHHCPMWAEVGQRSGFGLEDFWYVYPFDYREDPFYIYSACVQCKTSPPDGMISSMAFMRGW